MHSYEANVTAPTCTAAGFTTYTCACGDTYTADEVAATGHTNGAEATCTAPQTCTACNEVIVAALGHSFNGTTCATCGESLVAMDPVAGQAYLFGMTQKNLNNAVYYLKGGMSGYYMATTTNPAEALYVYLEETEGGYYMYCFVNGAKTYINMVVSGTHVNGAYEATASTVYTIDTAHNTVIAKVNGSDYWFGTRNDNTYTTAGPCAVSYAGFYCEFYGMHTHNYEKGETVAPTCTTEGYTPYVCSCGSIDKRDTVAPIEHTYTDGKCECGAMDPNYVAPHEHTFVEGKCECGETDPNYVAPETPVVGGGSADFNTIVTSNPNGDSSYTKTFTTTNGWIVKNSAIQCGGPEGCSNPQFHVIGPDNTYKAICLVGHTSNPGSLTSPTLVDGVSKIVINYTKMFTDTALSVTITVTDSNGNKYTDVLSVTLEKNDKYNVYTYEWVLETPVTGDFTIEIVNNCPTNQAGNKDRITILSIVWEGAAPAHEHSYENVVTTPANCTTAGVATPTCSCGETLEAVEIAKLGHIDENLDVDCDREGCSSKVAPAAESTLSIFTANNLGSKLSTSGSYYVEGVIVEVLDAKNGIFLIADKDDLTGETFYFRLPKDADGVTHANWAVKLVLGDYVRVYGKINKYSTTTAPNGQFWPSIQSGTVEVLERHPHDFTTKPATCSAPAYCACGQSYGEALGCADNNGDDLCDDCGKNVKFVYEYVEIRTDNNSGVADTTAGTYTWSNDNFDVQVNKGTSTQLYTTSKDHMRLYKGNNFVLINKTGRAVKTITVYLTNATQVTNFEKFLTGYTFTSDAENFTVTFEISALETLTLANTGSTTQIKGVEFGYEK